MNQKEKLLHEIEQNEQKLGLAEQESSVWNRGRYKTSSNAKISKIFVNSLHEEIKNLKKQLSDLE